LVSQLLVLMDGIEDRGRVLIIATTNFPQAIDPALLRPGRIDRRVFLGQPNRPGRLAQLTKLLSGKPVADDVNIEALATATKGLSGAELAHLVNEAGLRAIKESIAEGVPHAEVRIRREHFGLSSETGIKGN
jgi:SpoVK/Ycf46/Vps4 family AAA+-type ATPase